MHEIGVRIVDGGLKPGHTLPDNGFLDEAEVSRTVVREAIKVLAAKGLVESRPKVGPASGRDGIGTSSTPTFSPGRSKPARIRVF